VKKFLPIILLFSACSTNPNKVNKDKPVKDTLVTQNFNGKDISDPTNTLITDTIVDANKIKATDYVFFSDSVLHGHKAVLKYYFAKYGSGATCSSPQFYDKKEIKESFEGLNYIGSIKNNLTKDSVFVLQLFDCRQSDGKEFYGQAYYFTDTTLPRLQTDSYCCHPSNIFVVGDIDEDGVAEIGQYYSSCASHYKSLYVYSLKDNEWKEIGHVVYDLYYMDIGKPYSYFVKKLRKNKFEMLEITDLTADKTKIGKRNWKQFSM
jgi:hypothetical protein